MARYRTAHTETSTVLHIRQPNAADEHQIIAGRFWMASKKLIGVDANGECDWEMAALERSAQSRTRGLP